MKNKSNEKTAKIKTSFTAGKLTNYSGALPVYKFMEKIGLPALLNRTSIKLHHNAKYESGDIFSLIMLGIASGLNRIKKIETFSRDPLIKEIFGIKEKIDEDTLSNRIKRYGMRQTNELMDVIGAASKKVHKKLGTEGDILDIDSTPKVVYGKQEGAEKGFNHEKKGARSYHPLMAFLNSSRECLLSWLRPGDAYTSNNAAEFLKQSFEMLSGSIKYLLVRADRGFFDDKIISQIESRPHTGYIIKVKMKRPSDI